MSRFHVLSHGAPQTSAMFWIDPNLLRFEVLESTFNTPHFAPLGYFPDETYEQWAARYHHPFKQEGKTWSRDFVGMNAAAELALTKGFAEWSAEKRAEGLRLTAERFKTMYMKTKSKNTREELAEFMRQDEAAARKKEEEDRAASERLMLKYALKREAEEKEQERLEQLRLEGERLEQERLEQLRLEQERLEKERLEQLRDKERALKEEQRKQREAAKKAAKEAAAAKVREEEAALAEAMAEVERAAVAKKELEKKKAAAALEVQSKAKHVAEILRAEAKNALEIAELRRRAEKDLDSMVNQLKYFPQLDSVPNIPTQLALYSFLFCCLMRQTLMMDLLIYFGAWATAAKLPSHANFSVLFKDHQQTTAARLNSEAPPLYLNCSKKTLAAQLIVQTVRNIVGIVFDLRRLIKAGDCEDDFSPEFHSHFQVMFSICDQRQFSMSVLEGIDGLGASPELIALYKSVQTFENFCGGSDFVVFRQCFPLPSLQPMPMDCLPGKTPKQTYDFFLNIGMSSRLSKDMLATSKMHDDLLRSGVKAEHKEAEGWYKYLTLITSSAKEGGNIFDATRLVWSANFKTMCRWSKNPPTLESLNSTPAFEELLPSWFGADPATTRLQFSEREDFASEMLEDDIFACGLSMGYTQSQHQILAFLLAGEGSALYDWIATRKPLQPLVLPFTTTIQKVRRAHLTHSHNHKLTLIQSLPCAALECCLRYPHVHASHFRAQCAPAGACQEVESVLVCKPSFL